jgi:tripartite ATP-independent transporter DctP family solute receptor
MTAVRHLIRVALAGLSAAAALPALAQTTIQVSHPTPATSHYGAGTQAFCDDLDKRTSGRYKCRIQAGANDERANIEALQLGTLDVTNTSTGPIGNFVPETGIVDIPFLFRDYDHARRVLDGPIGQELLAKFPAKGIIALAWTENGFRHMTNSKRSIVKPEDVKGLKVRTMQNKVHMTALSSIGMQPTPMAFTELFTALQQGVVDGQENPLSVIVPARFSQVQKYLSLTGHVYSPSLLLASPRLWGSLSEADKKHFLEAAKAGAAAQRKAVSDFEASGIEQLRKEGMTVVTQVDSQAFRAAMTPVWSEFAKTYGAENIKRIQDFK